MAYRLGIDLGTASVGVAAASLTATNKPEKIIYGSVRIFEEPLEPPKSGGVGAPKKAARREARQGRHQHGRRAKRLRGVAQFAPKFGLNAADIPPDNGQKIIPLRANAVTAKIELADFFRVLLHLEKRRGYMGVFRDIKKKERKKAQAEEASPEQNEEEKKKAEEKREVKNGIANLREKMDALNHQTLGQYLRYRQREKLHCRLKEAGLYADVGMVRHEFSLIWDEQQKHHDVLKDGDLRQEVEKAVFFKLPLKSPAAMVGNCLLDPLLPRSPKAQPLAQAFAIEKQIADLRLRDGKKRRLLTTTQKEIVRGLLRDKKEVNLDVVKQELNLSDDAEINFQTSGRETLKGDSTMAAMSRLELGEEWQTLASVNQIQVINLLADMGEPDIFDEDDWDKRLHGAREKKPRAIAKETVDFINAMKKTGKLDRLSKMGFDSGRVSYSVKTLRTLVEAMRAENLDEYDAINRHYPSSANDLTAATDNFAAPPRTGNTVVNVAMRQLAREISNAVFNMGSAPDEIIVEMSRDMRLGLKQRNQISKRINENKKKRDAARKEIEGLGKAPTDNNILRYLLWDEQGTKCPYCRKCLMVGEALDGGETNYEHILPKALTRIGKNRNYLALSCVACNGEKEDKTPWQAWGADGERWIKIEKSAADYRDKKLYGKAKQLLYQEEEHLDDEAINGFTDRQFSETSWIAKIAAKWLRDLFPDVKISVSKGLLTAHFRRIWGLDTVIPELRYEENLPVFVRENEKGKMEVISQEDFNKHKRVYDGEKREERATEIPKLEKRIDHRHHLIDAAVICMTSPALYQKMAKDYQQASDKGDAKLSLRPAPPIKKIRRELRDIAADENIISHRRDRYIGGQLFKKNAYAVITRPDGKRVYAQRKMLTKLAKPNDLPKTVLGRVDKILCESTREIIRAAVELGVENGKKPSECLQQDIFHPRTHTKIRRVLIDTSENAADAVKISHFGRINRKGKTERTCLHKYLMPEGYAYLEVWKDEKGAIHKEPVRKHDALKNRNRRNGATRFYKNDTVTIKKGGKVEVYVIRQIKAESGGKLILQQVQDAREIASYTGGAAGRGVERISSLKKLAQMSVIPDRK